jgi:hypothetical protein
MTFLISGSKKDTLVAVRKQKVWAFYGKGSANNLQTSVDTENKP